MITLIRRVVTFREAVSDEMIVNQSEVSLARVLHMLRTPLRGQEIDLRISAVNVSGQEEQRHGSKGMEWPVCSHRRRPSAGRCALLLKSSVQWQHNDVRMGVSRGLGHETWLDCGWSATVLRERGRPWDRVSWFWGFRNNDEHARNRGHRVKRAAGCSNCENSTPRWHYSELLSDHYRHARSHRLRFSGVRDIAARASGRRGPKIGVSPRPGDLKTICDSRTLVCGSVDDCAASRLAGGAHTAANRLAKSLSRPSPRTSSGRSCAAVGRREPHRSTRTNPQPESES